MNNTRIIVIAGTLLLGHITAQAQELRRIFYGTSTSVAHLPVWVGKDTGLFAKNGLNIEPVQIRGGAVSTMAIMSGQTVLSGVGARLGDRPPVSRAATSCCSPAHRSRGGLSQSRAPR